MSHLRTRTFMPSCLVLVAVVAVQATFAQETVPEPATPPPSLDELLGLEEDTEADKEAEAPETEDLLEERRQQALEDRLQERSLAENFAAAVGDMEVAANMLAEQGDPGLELQRLQEEIIRRLDSVIKEAQEQQQQSSSSSSSSQQQQQQQQQQQEQQQVPSRPEQNEQQGEQNQQQQNQSQEGEQQPPARQEADLQALFEESDVEWGGLPDRLRDMIQQGLRESISRTYRRMTEEYYRKIAEEASE